MKSGTLRRLAQLEALWLAAMVQIDKVVIGGEPEPGDIVIGGSLISARWQDGNSEKAGSARSS